MKIEQEDNAARLTMRLGGVVDQQSGQRYTVFSAFLNAYFATGVEFYKDCAETFVYGP